MKINTRIFGEIDIDDEKIIEFDNGIIGFPLYKRFTLIYDVENEQDASIIWLQSVDEATLALPIINPLLIKDDYDPTIEDQFLEPLGELNPDETLIFVTVTVPSDIKKMTINLRAPIIVNAANKKAVQLIIEDDLPVRFPIYDLLSERNEKAKEGE
ncbi:MAG: flagellar assembly protein FliW [Eubacterium sp.]|nr:flagellar assembly protein FliW [Eubacterium sp.]